MGKRFALCVPCYFMKSPAPPHRSRHCLVRRALRQEATIYSAQKDFLRPRAAEDLFPVQKLSQLCFPPEPLRPREQDSLTASGSKGRRATSSESFLTSPPPLTEVRACAWWKGGQKVGPIVPRSPCPGPLQPVRLVKEKPSPIVFLRPDSGERACAAGPLGGRGGLGPMPLQGHPGAGVTCLVWLTWPEQF